MEEVIVRILICDNDPLITEQLEHLIRFYFKEHDLECPDINCYYNGNDLLNDTGDMDILFLDIEMPGINGILAGTELKKRHPNIIIFVVTSYAEYLDDAMRFHVFRYLSKPIDRQRFFRNLKEAIDLYYASIVKIPINTKDGIKLLYSSEIIFVETQSGKTIIHTSSGDYVSAFNMQHWTEALPKSCFLRTHRCYIVNLEYVADFSHTMVYLDHNRFQAYLSRRKYADFKKAFLLYLESTR